MTTRHVVLLTYGEPPVADFVAQLRYSWRILLGLTRTVAPIPLPLLPIIALSRARSRTSLWRTEDYRSPLEPITEAQAGELARVLAAREPGTTWRVTVAYEFRDPSLTRVLDAVPAGEPADVVPMYVTDSAFTHALSRTTLEAWLRARFPGGRPAPACVLPPLDEQQFAELSARHVLDELAKQGVQPDGTWALMLAAHGTLLDPPRPYETGRLATERVCAAIAKRLAPHFGMVTNGWLNHVYGGRWTEPPADVALRAIREAGYRRVVYYPYGFMADNAETQLEGRIALRGEPELQPMHLLCMNESAALLGALATQLTGRSAPQERGAAAS
jgi:protoheme ferro-lyase